jgi:hypothetical protein
MTSGMWRKDIDDWK